jgi:hypothetical protein
VKAPAVEQLQEELCKVLTEYIEPHHYSREEVEELLKLASSGKFNIFYDRNKIIINLCRTLLKIMEERNEQ